MNDESVRQLKEVLVAKGYTKVGDKLGEGGEGIVFDYGDDCVLKMWYDDDCNSYDLWVDLIGHDGLIKTYSHEWILLVPPIADSMMNSNFMHDRLFATVLEKATPITVSSNKDPFFVSLIDEYKDLEIAFDHLHKRDYKLAVENSGIHHQFMRSMISVFKAMQKIGYDELSPQLGVTKDKRVVLMDLV